MQIKRLDRVVAHDVALRLGGVFESRTTVILPVAEKEGGVRGVLQTPFRFQMIVERSGELTRIHGPHLLLIVTAGHVLSSATGIEFVQGQKIPNDLSCGKKNVDASGYIC